jgi:hypothetical protein
MGADRSPATSNGSPAAPGIGESNTSGFKALSNESLPR